MRALAALTAVLWSAGFAAPSLLAQEGTVSFPYREPFLQLRVLTGGAAGSIEVVDANAPQITLTDPRGGGGTSLRLEAGLLSVENRSRSPANYLVTVPAGVNVSITVDGRTVLAVAAAGGGRRMFWRWGGEEGPAAEAAYRDELVAPARTPRYRFVVNAFSGALVTDSVDLGYTDRIRAFKIVLGARSFAIRGDRSVSFAFHQESRWGVITPRAPETEITLELPADVGIFKVRVRDTVIWELKDGRGQAYCEPLAEVERRDGRKVWVFTPDAGRFTCPAERGVRLG